MLLFTGWSSLLACTRPNPAFDQDEGNTNGLLETGSADQGTSAGGSEASSDSASQTTQAPHTCGDEVVDLGEECDDGNDDSHDGCMGNCLIPRACAEILAYEPDASSGTYEIDPMSSGVPWLATCDMDFQGGGWTGFTLEDIVCDESLANDFFALVGEPLLEVNTESCTVFAVTGKTGGVFEFYWDIAFPPGFQAFFLRDYEVKAIGTPELNFVQTVWEEAADFPNGALSFGSAYDPGPTTTWLGEGGNGSSFKDGEIRPYPVLDEPFELVGSSDTLRIGFGERGKMLEGFHPWWEGQIFVR